MASRKLTDLINKDSDNLLLTDTHYIVDTTDTSNDPAGTSYKTTFGDMINAIKNLNGGISDGIATLNTNGKLKNAQVPDADKVPYDNSLNYLEIEDINVNLALNSLSKFIATSGQVQILDGNSIKPMTNNIITIDFTPTPEQIFKYTSPITIAPSPFTVWPRMAPVQSEASIWDNVNETFLENTSLGQSHQWNFNFSFIRQINIDDNFVIIIKFFNVITGEEYMNNVSINNEIANGKFSINFNTIANNTSLPSPIGTGNGYQLTSSIIGKKNIDCDITLESMTRISLLNTYVST